MSPIVELITFVRHQFVAAVEGLTVEQMNDIPAGFNNNIVWNLAHIIAVQQEYGYRRVGATPIIDEAIITAYGNGTVPTTPVDQAGIDAIKALAISSMADLKRDIAGGVFANYQPLIVTPDKIALQTLDDTLSFILFHDGLHLATARAMIRVLTADTAGLKRAA